MDKLVEILAEKKAFTLSILAGILMPSILLIFVWNRTMFCQFDALKILLLASSIGIALLIPIWFISFAGTDTYYQIKNKEEGKVYLVSYAIALAVTYIVLTSIGLLKIFYPKITVKKVVATVIIICLFTFLIEAIIWGVGKLCKAPSWIKKKKIKLAKKLRARKK